MTAAIAAAIHDPDATRVRGHFGIFVVSGICGLIYESIWSHYLKLFVGHAAHAQAVVLVFIGGMARGAWLVGRRAHRIRSPLRAYSLAQAVVELVSLIIHGLFVAAIGWAYSTLLPAACASESTVPDVHDALRPCVVMTGAAGRVASGNFAEADRLLTTMSGRLSMAAQNDPPLRLLAVLARSGLSQYEAAAAQPR